MHCPWCKRRFKTLYSQTMKFNTYTLILMLGQTTMDKSKLNSSLNSDKPIILINHLSYGTALQENILDKELKQTQKYM
jgi:cellobiose-specific phosphotransferase system component IIB